VARAREALTIAAMEEVRMTASVSGPDDAREQNRQSPARPERTALR
jgi:hypothetical protein